MSKHVQMFDVTWHDLQNGEEPEVWTALKPVLLFAFVLDHSSGGKVTAKW